MAKKGNSTEKVILNKRKSGKAVKNQNKHKSTKAYNGQGR